MLCHNAILIWGKKGINNNDYYLCLFSATVIVNIIIAAATALDRLRIAMRFIDLMNRMIQKHE